MAKLTKEQDRRNRVHDRRFERRVEAAIRAGDFMGYIALMTPPKGHISIRASSVEHEPPPFKVGDIVTLGTSKTRWRVHEVVENGVTMLQLRPIRRLNTVQ